MLHFSFSTVLMAFLTSITAAVFIAIIFSHKTTMICIGYKIFILLIGIVFVRLLFPFELPFTISIFLPQSLSKIISYIRQSQIPIRKTHISLWNLFEVVWIIGIFVNLFRYTLSYQQTQNYIQKYGQDKTTDSQYQNILDQICKQCNRNNSFQVIELPCLNVPIIFGWKHPCIILPDYMNIPQDKLYYVLYHEVMHHLHYSLPIKSVIRLLSSIYWWNPACIVLYQFSNTLMEMYIDAKITRNNIKITEQYTESLLYIKQASARHSVQSPPFLRGNMLSFAQSKNSDFKKRIWLLLQETKTWKKIVANIVLTVLTFCIFAVSYIFIFEANYRPPYFYKIFTAPTVENAYLITNDSVNYDLYINDTYIETITNLEYYPSGIKIYNNQQNLIYQTE